MDKIDLNSISKKLHSNEWNESKQQWTCDERHLRIMERFFLRMAQLYPHKFISAEGEHIKNGEYTNNFKRWCGELGHFTDKQWKRAYRRIEDDKTKAAHAGKDLWPPSSIDVVAYASPPLFTKMYKSFDRSTAVEDITKKEKRLELGISECDKLLKLFD
jgi:hypothetical protein